MASRSSNGSNSSIVDKGWNLISHNTELLIFIAVGFMGVLVETAGYQPFLHLNDLMPPLPSLDDYNGNNQNLTNITEQRDLTIPKTIYKISEGVDTVGFYTVHISLASYILLPYPVITEHQKVLLVPWLLVTLLRSVLRELIVTFVGIILCASHDIFYFPCVTYSVLQGAQFCFILYFWTSVHSFYHFLDKKNVTEARATSVINSLKRTSKLIESGSPLLGRSLDQVLSVDLSEDDDHTEGTLIERAAMAWISREILENDGDYVTDKQFSQYLVVKATVELRQALKELAEKKKAKKRSRRKLTAKEKIEESLEFMKWSPRQSEISFKHLTNQYGTQAFETSRALSKRDTIRKIRPLTSHGKPVLPDDVSEISALSLSALSDTTIKSAVSVNSEAQTEPPTHKMSDVLDIFESQQNQQQSKTSKDNLV